jgi:hypothetical protein
MSTELERANAAVDAGWDLVYVPDHLVGRDAVRCRPTDAPVVVEPTWQPAYAGPPRDVQKRRAPARAWRDRLVDLAENLLLAAATWIDERGRRTR